MNPKGMKNKQNDHLEDRKRTSKTKQLELINYARFIESSIKHQNSQIYDIKQYQDKIIQQLQDRSKALKFIHCIHSYVKEYLTISKEFKQFKQSYQITNSKKEQKQEKDKITILFKKIITKEYKEAFQYNEKNFNNGNYKKLIQNCYFAHLMINIFQRNDQAIVLQYLGEKYCKLYIKMIQIQESLQKLENIKLQFLDEALKQIIEENDQNKQFLYITDPNLRLSLKQIYYKLDVYKSNQKVINSILSNVQMFNPQESQQKNMVESIRKLVEQITNNRQQINSLLERIERQQNLKKRYQEEMSSMKKCFETQKQELSKINEQQKSKEKAELEQTLKAWHQEEMSSMKKCFETQKQELSKINEQQHQRELLFEKQKNELNKKIANLANESLSTIDKYFYGNMLDNCKTQKQKLLILLRELTKKDILKTKLLYQYDQFNPTNIHKYIDGHENILLLIKLVNGNILGGFSFDKFDNKESAKSFGGLFSLTNEEIFESNFDNKNYKPITYEPEHIIFGFSELKVKSNSLNVFSNFGIKNNFFNTNEKDVNILLGQGKKRQVAAESYEFYKLHFEQ